MNDNLQWLDTESFVASTCKLQWRDADTMWSRGGGSRTTKTMRRASRKFMNEINGEAALVDHAIKNKRVKQKVFASKTVAEATEILMKELTVNFYPVDAKQLRGVVEQKFSFIPSTPVKPTKRYHSNSERTSSSANPKRPCLSPITSPHMSPIPISPSSSSDDESRPVRQRLAFEEDQPIKEKRVACIQNLMELGRYHEANADSLTDITDGEATAIGIASALMEAPDMTVETLADSVFIQEMQIGSSINLRARAYIRVRPAKPDLIHCVCVCV